MNRVVQTFALKTFWQVQDSPPFQGFENLQAAAAAAAVVAGVILVGVDLQQMRKLVLP